MSRYDQPGDDSWRDPIRSARRRACAACGRDFVDDSDGYTLHVLCNGCIRESRAVAEAKRALPETRTA